MKNKIYSKKWKLNLGQSFSSYFFYRPTLQFNVKNHLYLFKIFKIFVLQITRLSKLCVATANAQFVFLIFFFLLDRINQASV